MSRPRVPESAASVAARMAAVEAGWRVVVPYYTRAAGRSTSQVAVNRYPPKGVSPYSFEEAVALLRIFSQRYLGNGHLPPPGMEPVAVEAVTAAELGWTRLPVRFRLADVDPDVRRLPRAPTVAPPPAAPPADDDPSPGRSVDA